MPHPGPPGAINTAADGGATCPDTGESLMEHVVLHLPGVVMAVASARVAVPDQVHGGPIKLQPLAFSLCL